MHGGLDPSGRPRSAADAWPTLHCQCDLPFDLKVPPEPADFEPLWRLAERLTQQFADDQTALIVAPRQWRFVGRSDPRGNDPALWFYRHGHAPGHQIALPLDAGGRVYRAKVDRRRARGHRWVRAHEAQLIAAAPLDAVTVWSERPFGRRANLTPRR